MTIHAHKKYRPKGQHICAKKSSLVAMTGEHYYFTDFLEFVLVFISWLSVNILMSFLGTKHLFFIIPDIFVRSPRLKSPLFTASFIVAIFP